MASAFVRNVNGSPAIVVDGRPYPPMMFTFAYWVERDQDELRAYCRRLGEAGMRLFYVCADTRWHTPGNPATGEPDGVEAAVRNIRLILDAVPEAHFLIRLNVSPPRDWVNAHPEEHIVFSDGKKRPVICTSVSSEPIDAMHSLCSENWRARGDEAIGDFLAALSAHPEYGRVIGVFLCAGRTDEWYYTQPLMNEDGSYGDFSEHFRREYEAFLRRKYGTVEELRRVWRRPDATFEHPVIPTPAERAYAGCHLFQRGGDVLYANENFVAVHAKDDGRRTIRFKRPCSPFEVYEKRFYGHDVESIEVDMALGQTLMWSLAGPC